MVPDRCTITVNRRFAPKYTPEEAEAQVRELLEGADDIEILQAQLAAPPNLTDPLVDEFVERPLAAGAAEARLDRRRQVRRAAASPRSTSAPAIPRSRTPQGEFVTRASVERCYDVLSQFVGVSVGVA